MSHMFQLFDNLQGKARGLSRNVVYPSLLPFTCALGILSRVKVRVYKTNKYKRIAIFLLRSYSGNTPYSYCLYCTGENMTALRKLS